MNKTIEIKISNNINKSPNLISIRCTNHSKPKKFQKKISKKKKGACPKLYMKVTDLYCLCHFFIFFKKLKVVFTLSLNSMDKLKKNK